MAKLKWRNRVLERGVTVDRVRGYVYVRLKKAGRTQKELIGKASDLEVIDKANQRVQHLRQQARVHPDAFLSRPKRMLVEDAVDVFFRLHCANSSTPKGVKQFAHYMSLVKRIWGGRYIDTITADDMKHYRRTRRSEGVSEGTVNREHTSIITLFKRLVDWRETGAIPANVVLPRTNPGRGVRKVSEERFIRSRLLSAAELERLCACADERLRRIIIAEMNLPLRLSDLSRLNKRDINHNRRQFKGVQAKTGYEYTLPINDAMWDLIETAPEERILDFSGFPKRWRRAINLAGLGARSRSPIQFRDLRRTAATTLYDAGVPLRTVSAMLGHRSVITTIRYLGLRDENLTLAGAVLARAYSLPRVSGQTPVESVPKSVPTTGLDAKRKTNDSHLKINHLAG